MHGLTDVFHGFGKAAGTTTVEDAGLVFGTFHHQRSPHDMIAFLDMAIVPPLMHTR